MPRNYHQGELINEESKFDVTIVGAGLSGLVAAFRLLEADPNLKVVIVEKEDYLGGQLVTSCQGEVGGKWVSMDNDIQPEVSFVCKLSATINTTTINNVTDS